MKMQKIEGFENICVDGVRYEWNPTFREYWTVSGVPRVLQANDAAILSLNDKVLFVGDPTSVGFSFKSITDQSFTGRTKNEHDIYLEELRQSLKITSWKGTLKWVFGDSSDQVVL